MMRVVLSAVLAASVAALALPGTANADDPGVRRAVKRVAPAYQVRHAVRRHIRHAVRPYVHPYRYRTAMRYRHSAPAYYDDAPAYDVAPAVHYAPAYQQVEVAPAQIYAKRIPAKYATVYETVTVPRTVMVEPERVVHYATPAQYATVAVKPTYHHWHWGYRRSSCGCW